ncbi:hypothetical protein J32TS2_04070 [Shouchella clausii]|uniref:AzlC family ABC transporter permease n=1 Tax=Shouchella clausii TaxID=79880 RepID=UPI00079137FB|nr:AzlC family ABC transporter permease [Shouchella clausii]KKI87061.1 branched-chain amino acid ABC transporter permease [Shouchella clausii]PAD46102.1 branched-chain amino acid ABC transporter permease [Shouchella clausii]PAE83338.1 branched-chain amino acid ABC transporter permease [Shouchella clausii]PAF09503.1 branched-chain amino acid ABC transporter permease [Shouchella clausii]GIN15051.1 hypothetical protein J32TS2_04070 [Shouchella clausii]
MVGRKQITQAAITEAFPLALAIAAYGISYGVLATQGGFTFGQTVTMSMFVFSGSAQLVTAGMMAGGASAISILAAVLLLNLRNLLYGAALANTVSLAGKWRFALAFGVSDEPFVLASAREQKHGPDPFYFAIVFVCFYLSWVFASLAGALLGAQVDPLTWGLDFVFPVTFTALLVPSLKGRPAIATALAAIGICLLFHYSGFREELIVIAAGMLAPLAGLMAGGRKSDGQ